jgi:hypothetical protein
LTRWDRRPRIKVIRTKVVPFVARLAVAFTGDGIKSGAVVTTLRVHMSPSQPSQEYA